MTMTNAEIVADYRQAKDKRAQIKILADLNDTGVSVIKEILRDAGEAIPGRRPSVEHAAAEAMWQAGATDGEIAEAMQVSPRSVYNWRYRNGLPSNGAPAAEAKKAAPTKTSAASAPGGLPDVCRRIEAVLAALPTGSSEASRAAACELCRCLLWDAVGQGGTGLTSNESARTDSP